MALTERKIRDAKPSGGKQTFVRDDKLRGFALRVTPAGVKSYTVEGRKADGTKFRSVIGRVEEITLKEARDRAAAELAAARAGEATLTERKREAREAPTVADLAAAYLDKCERKGRAAKTLYGYRQQLNAYILPALGRKAVAAVTRGDIEAMIEPLRRVTGNRVASLASAMFREAERKEWRTQNSNPAFAIERNREEARDRTFRADELAAFSAALADLEAVSPAPVAAIRFAALTGLRISEVLAVRWQDIGEDETLVLPKTKTGRRVASIPAPALAILDSLPRLCDWAFTADGSRPLAYASAWRVFGLAKTAAGVEGVTLHDLRRTVMTQAAASGVSAHVLRDLLGHKSAAVAERYIRALGNPVREARDTAANAMADMMAGGKVIPLRRRA